MRANKVCLLSDLIYHHPDKTSEKASMRSVEKVRVCGEMMPKSMAHLCSLTKSRAKKKTFLAKTTSKGHISFPVWKHEIVLCRPHLYPDCLLFSVCDDHSSD